ncbi:MAG: SIMPL domain-containing protein [Pirellulales bacterium]
MRRTLLPAAVFAAAIFTVSLAAAQSESNDQRTITVVGTGKAAAPPDMATIDVGVTSQAATAGEALNANSRAVERVIDIIKGFDVADRDIQTANFDVSPVYEQTDRPRSPSIIGYRVSNQVRVRVRKLEDLGPLLDESVSTGSNQIGGIQFGIDNADRLEREARVNAIQDAKSRAETYAQAAGVSVGRVIAISEEPPQRPMPYAGARLQMAESSVPIQTGEHEVQANVHVVYAIGGE